MSIYDKIREVENKEQEAFNKIPMLHKMLKEREAEYRKNAMGTFEELEQG